MGCIPSSEFPKEEGAKTVSKDLPIASKNNTVHKGKEIEEAKEIKIGVGQFVIGGRDKIEDVYEIESKSIGEGAYGVVKKGRHKSTNEMRAIKQLSRNRITPEEEEVILKEIEILKGLDHPNIVKLFEFYMDAKYYYLVTEMVPEGDLFSFIEKKSIIDEGLAASIISQLLGAITYCHDKKVVHRDLKPENMLVSCADPKAFKIKVIDFGTADTFEKAVKLTKKIGTSYYIAPEVLGGNYDQRCDIWSVGVIMYILLCGSPPFYGKTDEEIMKKVKRGIVMYHGDVWNVITKDARALVEKMLKVNPDERISAKDALRHPWIQKKNFNSFDKETAASVLENLNKFHSETKLQQAAFMYIISQLTGAKEKSELEKTFKQLDTNGDGKLSREELIQGYTLIYGDKEKATSEAERILKEVDLDGNGYVDYSEYLMASASKEKALSMENLKTAFHLFDSDGSGYITSDEIKTILGVGQNISEKVWEDVIKQVDENQDGKISFEEFAAMMNKFLS